MVPFNQVQKGVANYLDNEVMPAFKDEGWKKILIGSVIAVAIQRSEKFLPMIQQNQFLKQLELVDEDGSIDVEGLLPVVKAQMADEPFVVDIPRLGLGSLKFNASDVDKLAEYIRMADRR